MDRLKRFLLIVSMLLLLAVSVYYYSNVYLPANQQADQIERLTN